ncbi:restriction endonuclease subunit S [Pseudomonas sp. CAN2814]|uniref:restriction endonuclease subunit S n=1 Tax=Pseudomonas sp. CAN1 TaxID=3046726 RepID=UPI0026485F4E|nr:restriction endonuclease subunit S [Pseudomonas sp. CAN1]MDN6857305.1 restriction endonuclease subunit S [Pseudomonas sp. CAN1]
MNELPEGWTVEPFSQIASYTTGRTPARANPAYWAKGERLVPWVAISDMEQYGTIVGTAESVSALAFENVFRKRIVPAGTLIMSFKLTIGRVATLGIPACHNEAIISIFPREGVDQRYLGYFLSQVDYTDHQDRQIKGNTLNQSKIDQIQVVLPSSSEQSRIADVLDKCRLGINTERAAEKTAEELKRACMHELFRRGLRGEPLKETEIGPVPESWEVVPLGSLGKIGNGSTPKKTVPAYWNDGTFPWLTSAKVYDREIEVADQFVTDVALAECHLPRVQPGAVLMAITGQGKTLGHCAVLRIEASINQHIAYLQTNTERAEPGFIRGYLETQYEYLRQVASGGGSTKGALTCAFLKSLPVPLPPTLDEQREIVTVLDALDRKIGLHQQKRGVLEELFKALLHKLMTGEIAVLDLDLSALSPASTQPEEATA